MECAAAREAISARIDGEPPVGDERDLLERHLRGCPLCRSWEDEAYRLRRLVAFRRPAPPSDLTARVLQRAGVPDAGAGEWIRYVLGVVAASLVLLNLPRLLGSGPATQLHDERHLGAFGLALGAGLLWAAVRPERAIGLVPLAGALAAAMAVSAAVDLAAERATALGESYHLLEVLGLVLLWVLSGGRRRLARRLGGNGAGPLEALLARGRTRRFHSV